MGELHIEGFEKCDLCEVSALADIDRGRLDAVGDKYGIRHRYLQAEKMFDEAGLDAVSIAVPNHLHCSMTLAALESRMHVLCEKPMALNAAEAEQMQAAAEAAGKTLMLNMSFRFSAASFALKRQIEAGVIGDIYFGRTVWHRRRGIPGLDGSMPGKGPWFLRKEQSGGGAMIDLGVHRLDLALWLMGFPEARSVCGSSYNVIAQQLAAQAETKLDVDDLACGMIKFANGTTLILEASWALHLKEKEHMVTALYGDKGGAVQRNVGGAYGMEAVVYTEEQGYLYSKTMDHPCNAIPSAYEEFVASIAEGREPLATAEQGVTVQRILDGLYASATEGREVRLS